jgi:NYN domain
MRTIVYVDGLNLYYRLLKANPQFKWLNPVQLAREVLSRQNIITKVRFFTARVSGRFDPGAPLRQQIYLDALGTLPELEIHYGNFLVSKVWAGLVPPDLDPAKPSAKPPLVPWPKLARVFKSEEKGSDVNLATYMLTDSFDNAFDVAAVITNDTDLCEPIRIITQQMGKVVGLLTPVAQPARSLSRLVAFTHHIRDHHLALSQFSNPVVLPNGTSLHRPATWE